MKSHGTEAFMLAIVLFVCGALLYLDWRRQGEVELLHARVDELDRRVTLAVVKDSRTGATLDIESILRAPDDRTLADIAREEA